MPTSCENAAFEAGIKLGALYHQFIGMPININMIDRVKRIIEDSIKNQPYVKDVKVHIKRDEVEKNINIFGYTTLKSRMLTVTVTVIYNDCLAKAIMDYNEELQFSLMKLVEIRRINPR
ncbi:hypothetical protein DRN87_01025 [Candidatus Geothermarchaeota archaeon]|nr:MAG: hypothetical protein DRN87_01025 [Candidatus Geothermarchaeota archaeon]HEW93233.1 hypothetical protein [Thermoprotei archaeon]